MKGFFGRYAHARAWRECPACEGRGSETDWKAVVRGSNRWDRPCYLCGGGGEVRFTAWIAFRVAIGWIDDEIRNSLEREPHFSGVPR